MSRLDTILSAIRTGGLSLRRVSETDQQREQVALLTALEKALRSRSRFTVQCMPNGCEIIDCDSGDLIQTIRLTSVALPPELS